MQKLLISSKTRSGTEVSFLNFLWVSKAYKSQKKSSRYLFSSGHCDDCTVLGRTQTLIDESKVSLF